MPSSKARALTQPTTEAAVPDSSTKNNWLFFFVGAVLFTVLMMLLSFPVGLYTVFGTTLSGNYSASTSVHGLIYDFIFATVQVPVGGNLGDIFAVALLIYLGFFILAARQGTGVFGSLRASIRDGYKALFTNPLVAMLVLLGATSLVTEALDTLQSSGGIATGSLSGDPFSLLVDFTIAPLLEETTFRLIMLGVPILLLALLLLRDFSPSRILKVLWRPSSAWDSDETDGVASRSFADSDLAIFSGYPSDSLKARAMRPVVLVFLVLSSIIFGYSHYASGSGWGPGKISEAALAGLALGYLYIRYGFHTSVLLHWSINYVGSIYSFFGQGAYGVPWTSNTGSFLDVVPTLDFVLLLGVPSTLILMNELLKRALAGRQSVQSPVQAS